MKMEPLGDQHRRLDAKWNPLGDQNGSIWVIEMEPVGDQHNRLDHYKLEPLG